MTIRTVGVLGAGLMGSGIAQVVAASGYQAILHDVDSRALDRALARITKLLNDGVAKGKLAADAPAFTLAHLQRTSSLDALAACDVVIEAIVENTDAKHAAFAAVEAVVRPDTVLLSNTSSICITELAAATRRPDRFAGLHFFNPVPRMALVEVIRALTTSDETHRLATDFARAIGKEPIDAPDRPGFIVNRLLIPYLLDAIRAHENGLGSIEAIDKGMTLGCGHPIGPFALLDFVGLDTAYHVANIMFEEFREPAYAPPPLLKRMVLAGWLGRKSGRGFYVYGQNRG